MKKAGWLIGWLIVLSGCTSETIYHYYEGPIFGTGFHITYATRANRSLDQKILKKLNEFNHSLSTYDPGSVISRVNQNDSTVRLDKYFTTVFNRSTEISDLTGGTFDITVAPLVNAWGFGFAGKKEMNQSRIDSLLALTGYRKVHLEDGRVVKEDPRIMLDCSAIAKGYGVDVVSEYLELLGVKDYLVEIGGEMRCKGLNPKGKMWRVGIDKPLESLITRKIQEVVQVTDMAIATSGNYRRFYIENGVKYAHTIDPSTGYPARSNLLSATVMADDCMTADAFATAFMVMGLDRAIRLSDSLSGIEVFFIYGDENGDFKEYASSGMRSRIVSYTSSGQSSLQSVHPEKAGSGDL